MPLLQLLSSVSGTVLWQLAVENDIAVWVNETHWGNTESDDLDCSVPGPSVLCGAFDSHALAKPGAANYVASRVWRPANRYGIDLQSEEPRAWHVHASSSEGGSRRISVLTRDSAAKEWRAAVEWAARELGCEWHHVILLGPSGDQVWHPCEVDDKDVLLAMPLQDSARPAILVDIKVTLSFIVECSSKTFRCRCK